ncbi:MAG TPA: 2-phospho-L-lactate guanylyltransferase [Terriglobales bacterium]|nr:2-phospho-L-lactate guanylyltransferase [Terriglobales bacterium]
MILVPVKNLANAKQRLASVVGQGTRTELARAMLHDVLDALAMCSSRQQVALVTSDPFAVDLAREFNFEVIPDLANFSETDAIEMATQLCESRGVESTLVIPADIPLIQSSEVTTILQAAPEDGSVLVPAADGRGTNAVLRRPAALFPLRFGNDSFKPHLAAAHASRKLCVVLSLPGIALDIDNPSDLATLASAPGDTRAQCMIRQWNMRQHPVAANE